MEHCLATQTQQWPLGFSIKKEKKKENEENEEEKSNKNGVEEEVDGEG